MKERAATGVYKIAGVQTYYSDPTTGKPCLRLEFPDGLIIYISTNLAEMIGGAGTGTRLRWEETGV